MSVKIFISCVSDEFRAYRDQLRHDLTLPDVEVKIQEDFKDQGRGTLDELDTYISACDAVVHLVGDMTGAVPKPELTRALLAKYPDIAQKLPPLREPLEQGEDISYTRWEAWLALYHDKLLLIAKADATAPRELKFAPSPASLKAQQAHLHRLRTYGRYPGCTFVTADQLAKYVLSSPVPKLMADEQSRAAERGAGWSIDIGLAAIGVVICVLVLLATPIVADEWAKTLGVPIAAPLALVLAAGCIVLPLMFVRYFMMLGASDAPAGSRDRQGYDTLRENLATGGPAVRLYARWLTAFLDRVDRFFGDASMADRTLFPHAFGLKTPAPLWTAPAFDRCLSLALVYPIVAVFVIWAVSGEFGPAEAVLGFAWHAPAWMRGIFVTAATVIAFGLWRVSLLRLPGIILAVFYSTYYSIDDLGAASIAVISPIVAVIATRSGSRSVLVAMAISMVTARFSAACVFVTIVVALSFTFGSLTRVTAVVLGFLGFVAVAYLLLALAAAVFYPDSDFDILDGVGVAVAISGAVALAWPKDVATIKRHQNRFLFAFFVATALVCLVAAYSLSSLQDWIALGPSLLFLGFLTLLNAPFDWASLGLTRALLRRGLELRGWWPFVLAVADALCAAVLIVLLALILVLGVQTFDALALHGGGRPVLPLMSYGGLDFTRFPKFPGNPLSTPLPLLEGIAEQPEALPFWWVYALLLSTLIPSLINLVIGGTALVRAVPGLSSALLNFLPATGGVPAYDRAWIAAVLTLQVAFGAILGVAVQALVAWSLIFYVMPIVGLDLLDLARDLAELDLPARVIAFVAGTAN